MYRRIVVPLDGSRFAEYAVAPALGIAAGTGAAVELVTVFRSRDPGALAGAGGGREPAAAEYLERVRARVKGGAESVDVSVTVVPGARPSSALVEHLRERGADLVVMTTHGRGPFSRLWLGSTAERMLRRSPGPLLLLRPDPDDETDLPTPMEPARPFRHLLVPLDGSERARRSLVPVRALARQEGIRVTLFRALPPAGAAAYPYLPRDERGKGTGRESEGRQAALEFLGEVAAELAEEGIHARAAVRTVNQPATGILDFVEPEGVDLVVMARSHRSGMSRLLGGSVVDKVVRGAPVPVLVHRDRED